MLAGTGPAEPPPLWSIRDVTPMVLDHFGVDRAGGSVSS
jgi:hypothetical protein